MCITLEIHNMIYLYTISFRHFTAWPFGGLPWILRIVSLRCANFATLKNTEGRRCSDKLFLCYSQSATDTRGFMCQTREHKLLSPTLTESWQLWKKTNGRGNFSASIFVWERSSASRQQMIVVQFLVFCEGWGIFSFSLPLTGCHCGSKSGVVTPSH